MNNLCVTTKCKYCELVILLSDNSFFQYRCTAQKDAPRVYSDSDCPYKKKEAGHDNTGN